ncbi:sirq protein [Colletotrichum truncatum]|uniref:Sirq protein n=1 Tax=Colletotrichum truncatum TaxID=5467 RepID=A0ACC3ZBF3_COLTU|nr:sirq protein [Colletotrichum truncatum]KAF6787768.1 sirq protein [Colletotrichum truncatum]
MSERNHAIVFGAAGLIGWSTVNQLLSNYPAKGSFDKVTAVINRPLPEAEFHWPQNSSSRPELQIVPKVNLFDVTAEELSQQLKANVSGIKDVTHVFYFVFKEVNDNHILECQVNCEMMQRVVDAITSLSHKLKSVVYPGGTRGYGIYVPGGTFQPPLEESMADNLPEDYAKTVAYPWFRKLLTKASEGKSWTWTEVCPDAVVGFTPNGSGWSLALHWAQYLSLYAHNHKSSADKSTSPVEVPFPGTEGGFDGLFTPVSSHTLGRVIVHASLSTDKCGGKIINVADSENPTKFREIWPALAEWFGLRGTDPSGEENVLKPGEYVQRHKHLFQEMGLHKAVTAGVGAGASQLDSVGYWLSFDRQLSLKRLREVDFVEERDPIEGWLEALEQFREAGIII